MIAEMMDDDSGPKGETLRDRLQSCRDEGMKGIPEKELLGYLQEIALALDSRHARHSLHGNVNPGAMLVQDGRARLTDGAAPAVASEGEFLGTPAYLAPEAWRGERCPASDQYALAVSYVELRRGRLPFRGESMIALIREHLEMSPDLSGLTASEAQVLLTALAKDPRRRHASCAEFAEALKRAVDGQ